MKLHAISAALIIGIININYSVDGVILQRNLVTGNTFKWVVRIVSTKPNMAPETRDEYPIVSVYCTGSIITRWHILTAAHCFENISENDVTVMAGVTCVHSDCESGHKVKKIHRHPNYDFRTVNIPGVGVMTPEFKLNDVAVLTLETVLVFGPEIGEISLPTRQPSRDSLCQALGWIEHSVDSNYQRLFWTNIKIERTDENEISECLMNKLICGRSPANDTLLRNGDSGGGLLCDGAVAGIAMRAPRELNHLPMYFQTTYHFLSFIQDICREDAVPLGNSSCVRPGSRQQRECVCL